FGGEFTDVHSYVTNDYWNHDVEDNAYALMRTADGVVAMLHSSATQWRHRFNLDITLTQGALELSGILSSSKSYGAETLRVVFKGEDEGGDPREQVTRHNRDNSWRDEVYDVADAVNDIAIGTGSRVKPFRAVSLTDNLAALTAIANDHGYDDVFVRQLEYTLREGDVVVAISVSGNSQNVVSAVEYAIERGARPIA